MSYLELTKKLAATVANRQRTSQREAATFDPDAGELVAVKLRKTIVGDCWLVADADALADNPDLLRCGLPLFFFDEMEQLRGKTPAELKAICMVKATFPTGRVLQ